MKKTVCKGKLDLNWSKKLVKCYILSIALYGAVTWDTSESRSETLGKFWNVVLDEDGEEQSDRLCEKWRSVTQSQGRRRVSYIQ
jgi:hypothetical protein